MDVHLFDGKLDIQNLKLNNNLTLEEKLRLCQELNPLIKGKALIYYWMIMRDKDGKSNYDPSNNLSALDLLAMAASHKDNPDFILLLNSQLKDMATGSCPQGRTHRLFQLLMAFNKDNLTPPDKSSNELPPTIPVSHVE